jgi:hypothetical protein
MEVFVSSGIRPFLKKFKYTKKNSLFLFSYARNTHKLRALALKRKTKVIRYITLIYNHIIYKSLYKLLIRVKKFSYILFSYLLKRSKYRLKRKIRKFFKRKKRILTAYKYKLPKKHFFTPRYQYRINKRLNMTTKINRFKSKLKGNTTFLNRPPFKFLKSK